MKRFLIAFLFILVLSPYGYAGIFTRFFTSLTGEVPGSVDNIDCDDVYGTGSSTDDGTGYVVTSSGSRYFYYFDQSATNATSSPDYIRCKNYTTSGVWIRQDMPDNEVDSDHYVDGSIDPEHLNIANSETDEYALTYEADTGNFQWVDIPGGGDITTVGDCTTGDCTDDFIDGTDIGDDVVESEHYAAGSIDAEHMAADIVDETKIADEGIDSEHYNDGSIDPEHLDIANAETDEYVLSYEADTTNFQWVEHAAGGDITTVGGCTTGDCTDDFVDGTDIADDVIESEHYGAGSIDAEHLAADIIEETKIADDGVDSEHYNDASIDPAHLNIANAETDEYVLSYEADTTNFQWIELTAGGDITTVGTCTTGDCTDDFVDGTDIADDAIDSEHYTDGSIDLAHLAADSVNGTKMADDAVDSEHYTDGSIDPAHLNIANAETDEYVLTYETDTSNFQWVELAGGGDITMVGGCTTGDCTDDFIDGSDIGDDIVESEHYAAGSIDAEHLAADIIDETKIADDGIDSEHYNDGSIDPAHLNIANAETDEYALTYEADTSNYQWVLIDPTYLGLVIGTDVLAEQTIGIADDNLVEVDGSPNDDEYARFTANGIEGRTESEFKGDFNLEADVDFNAYDADLTTYAGITPSADIQLLLAAANKAAMLVYLGLVIGTDVQADLAVPSQAEAEAGSATTERVWTAERVKQAIDAIGDVAYEPLDAAIVKSDEGETISVEWTFSAFPITASAAPDADYEVANKKYVDDNTSTKQDALTNEAGLYSALSDVTEFVETDDTGVGVSLATLELDKLTGAPGSPVAGQIYYADNTTWNPATLSGSAAYYAIYDGADYVALFDEDGAWYVSTVSLGLKQNNVDLDVIGADYTIPATGCYGEQYRVERSAGTDDILLPDVCDTYDEDNLRHVYIVKSTDTETISIGVTDALDKISWAGTILDADDELDVTGATYREFVWLVCDYASGGAGIWTAYNYRGTFADGGAAD